MRKKVAAIGGQVGDEGKGSIVDYLVTEAADRISYNIPIGRKPTLVHRFQGGTNAGHTVIVGDQEYKLHLVPSGIITKTAYNLMGKGMFIDTRKGKKEIEGLQKAGVEITKFNLGIAANAHVTLDYHVQDDQAAFNQKFHSTTGSGIKQTAVDKYGRVGIRFVEFLDAKLMEEILREKRFPEGLPEGYGSFEEFVASYDEEREFLKEFLVLEQDAIASHGEDFWIFEGAQGFFLGTEDGLYPGVSSSNPTQVPYRPDLILSVMKLYNSSVGWRDRSFVSHIKEEEIEDQLVELWGEKGTTTGKKRSLGWFDAVAAKYSADVSQTDYLVGTCGDRLADLKKLGEKPKIVVGYKIKDKVYNEWNALFERRDTLRDAEPVLKEFEAWEQFTEEGQLTANAQRYVDFIQEFVGKEFALMSTGPKRTDMLVYKHPLDR